MESVAATNASLPSDSVRREFVHLAHGRICVVGNRGFQNGLLVHFLRQSTGLPCEALDSVRHVRLREKEDSMQQRQILWDFLGQDPEKILVELETEGRGILDRHLVALLNVLPGSGVEEKAVALGVRGFFMRTILWICS